MPANGLIQRANFNGLLQELCFALVAEPLYCKTSIELIGSGKNEKHI